MTPRTAERIAGIEIPDSALAREAAELVRDTAGDLLYHHSRRVHLFGALRGHRRGLDFDPELLYVAALFHDLGLTQKYAASEQRFEIDGADAARDFLLRHGLAPERARIAWTAIALHTTPEIPYHMEPEVALVTAGVEVDVLGLGFDEVTREQRDAVVAAHPRPDFKRRILAAFTEGIAHRPGTAFGNVKADVLARFSPGFVRTDFVNVIENSEWSE
ncbi:HD domain-containing protein [Streptomyces sp. TRM66268-LWL]|uniref:HD domain-containing protein n=1 Tax=Streptomyces polyasparticus TaxID=2767826 RepID=A0ABR7SDZ8_9ACTN|nr:HD domain-containing protein [Streptomyces polyasparticus]MBC9713204.1 HD domain-containing protein [Streptomyces polyasparticus]